MLSNYFGVLWVTYTLAYLAPLRLSHALGLKFFFCNCTENNFAPLLQTSSSSVTITQRLSLFMALSSRALPHSIHFFKFYHWLLLNEPIPLPWLLSMIFYFLQDPHLMHLLLGFSLADTFISSNIGVPFFFCLQESCLFIEFYFHGLGWLPYSTNLGVIIIIIIVVVTCSLSMSSLICLDIQSFFWILCLDVLPFLYEIITGLVFYVGDMLSFFMVLVSVSVLGLAHLE